MDDHRNWEAVDCRQQWAVLYVRRNRTDRDVLTLHESEYAARDDFDQDSKALSMGRANSHLVLMVREGLDDSWGTVARRPTRVSDGTGA